MLYKETIEHKKKVFHATIFIRFNGLTECRLYESADEKQ